MRVNEGYDLDLPEALAIEATAWVVYSTEDGSEGLAAFLETRKPAGVTNIMGRPELREGCPTMRARTAADRQPQIHRHIEAWSSRSPPRSRWTAMDYMLNTRGPGTVATARVNSPTDTLEEGLWWGRGVFQHVEDPHYGRLLRQAPPWKMSRTPAADHVDRPAGGRRQRRRVQSLPRGAALGAARARRARRALDGPDRRG